MTGSGEPPAVPPLGDSFVEAVAATAPLVLFALDRDGVFSYSDGRGLGALGLDPGEVVGRSVFDVYADHPRVLESVDAALDGEAVNEVVEVSSATFEVWLRPVHGDRREAVVGVALDVTGRESAIERLHVATREMLDAGSVEDVARLTVGATVDILGLRKAVFRRLSADRTRLEPTAASEWILEHVGEPPAFDVGEGTVGTAFERGEVTSYDPSEIEDGLASREEGQLPTLLCLPVGEYGVLTIGDADPTEIGDADVRLARILVANAEAALHRVARERDLERQNQRLEQFASILSHDLRNPLNVVAGRVDLAREDEAHFEPILDAVDRMETIIDEVMELARHGEGATEPTTVRLERIARSSWDTVETPGASLAVEGDRPVVADPDRFHRLLENLFRNGIDHGEEGMTMRVGPFDGGFFVEDDGPGIPSGDRDAVFEMGYSTGGRGAGLGLAIVEQIAAAHGWHVRVTESREGGARFEFVGVEPS